MTTENSRPPSRQNLAKTIGRNTAFGVVARVAQVTTRLVTIPIVIAHLGLGGYGIWAIIMTTAAYMRFGSIGVKSAFQKYVAEATGNGDFATANKLLSTGCAAMLVLSIAGLIPLAFFSGALAKACGVPPEFMHSAAQSIAMLAIIMVLSNVGAVYEAIVMGGHRIDLTRNFSTFFTVAEAVAIIAFLQYGYGLFAMACVMAASEVGFVFSCYIASKKIMPQIHVRTAFVTKTVVHELVRFAGSYQLVNILEILYGAIIPVTVLRVFGADAAGVYAVSLRIVMSAMIGTEALILPILSGGAMVHASGSKDEMHVLIAKSVKVTLGLSLFPLAFIAAFGPAMLLAWIGQTDSSFRIALWLVCAAGFFQAFSLLGLVLYRASGKAFLDNIRQALRIVTLLFIAVFARRLGFYGLLGGLLLAEIVGAVFMFFALTRAFQGFRPRSLLLDASRLTAATVIVMTVAGMATLIPLPAISNVRLLAILQVGKVLAACALAAWPALWLTKSITRAESKAVLAVFLPQRRSRSHTCAESVVS
jgi:O-antigen/teichoic acid export membrane protein